MTSLSAKSHFLNTHSDELKAQLVEHVNAPITKTAMEYVMAQLAEELSAGSDTNLHAGILNGARRFRDNLLNLAEPIKPPSDLPVKSLEEIPTKVTVVKK